MILRSRNVYISLASIILREMRVFSQMRLFNDFSENSERKNRTWGNPMASTPQKSSYEIDDFIFLITSALFSLFENVLNIIISEVDLALLY